MPDNRLTQGLLVASFTIKEVVNNLLIGSLILNVAFKGALSLVFGMINSLQLILHLPIMNTPIPANVMTMFWILIPVVMFDLLEEYHIFESLFPDDDLNKQKT